MAAGKLQRSGTAYLSLLCVDASEPRGFAVDISCYIESRQCHIGDAESPGLESVDKV